ncbi:DUF4233 domain-containing protein [Kocuria sp. NPDC057446]|uniref:DUF4233 domain-containing protein n=1 Tax=Kocuria sp. NPDC057446 TaxID=3346137 RepID=UPI0036BE01DD
MTRAHRDDRRGQPRRRRSIRTMFASSVLVMEAFVAFFAALTAYGVLGRELGDGARTAILAGGAALALLLVLAPAVLGRPWGYAAGWVLQVLLLATGLVLPTMFFVGGLCVLAWWYAVRTGARLDRENVARDAAQAQWEREHPDG